MRYEAPAANVYQVPDSYYSPLGQAQQQYAPQQVQYDAPPAYGLDALAAYGRQISGMGTRAPVVPMAQIQAPAQSQAFDLQTALQNAMASRAALQNQGVAITGDAKRRADALMNPTQAAAAYYDNGGGDGGGGSAGDGDGDGDGGDGDGGDGSGGDGGGGDGGGGDGGGGERAGGLIMNAAREKAIKAYRKGDITFKQLCKALA